MYMPIRSQTWKGGGGGGKSGGCFYVPFLEGSGCLGTVKDSILAFQNSIFAT